MGPAQTDSVQSSLTCDVLNNKLSTRYYRYKSGLLGNQAHCSPLQVVGQQACASTLMQFLGTP